jgi:hypothetical protein
MLMMCQMLLRHMKVRSNSKDSDMTHDLSNRRIISFTLRLMYPVPTRKVDDQVMIHDFNTASEYTIGSPCNMKQRKRAGLD